MNARWERYRTEGDGRVPLTDAGREKIRQTARRTMRRRWAEGDAAFWVDWLMQQHADPTVRLWSDYRAKAILKPYLAALKTGGLERMQDLAEVAGINLRSLPDGAEITSIILARYAPKFDMSAAAEDLRKGAG